MLVFGCVRSCWCALSWFGVLCQCHWELQFKQCFVLVVGCFFNVVGNRSWALC